jgi:cephalosporin-C deacetylase-like acetyl esterase
VESTNCEHDYDGLPLSSDRGFHRPDFCACAIRSIDYLCSRPEVDPLKIGVTGSSGGGNPNLHVMMCEPRIAAAAPATFVMNRRTYLSTGNSQDSETNWRDCRRRESIM